MPADPKTTMPVTTFAPGDRVRMAHDYKFYGAVPFGAEGVVIKGSTPTHVVVDFGEHGERGCRAGEYLERVQNV